MKNFYTLFLYLFLTHLAYCQNDSIVGVVKYNLKLKLGLPSQNQSILYFNSKNSAFVQGKYNLTEKPEKLVNHSSSDKRNDQIIYFVDTFENKLYKKDKINKENILVEEKLPKIDWKINLNKKDTILGKLCYKAIGDFRGRTYSVWYAPNLPVKFGPWKIQGLPGLILKLNDNFKQIDFDAVSIEFKKIKDISQSLEAPKTTNNIINLKEYLQLSRQEDLEEIKRIMAMMPKDSKPSNMKLNEDRKSRMEMIYEWEQE